MIEFVPITRIWHAEQRRALAEAIAKYPGSGAWLERRLDDIAFGRAAMLGATFGGSLAAWAILAPKGSRAEKLCTFFVCPGFRGQGVGRGLLRRVQRRWRESGVEYAFVTADARDGRLGQFLPGSGFARSPGALVRYQGHSDDVYDWRINGHPLN